MISRDNKNILTWLNDCRSLKW